MLPMFKKGFYFALKNAQRSPYPRIYRTLKDNQYLPFKALAQQRDHHLRRLLADAVAGVPFYSERLGQARTVHRGDVDLSCWERLPALTRQDVTVQGSALLHAKCRERGMYYAATGGSTGQPIPIAQDWYTRDWMHASYFFMNEWGGLYFGMPYFLLWASENDLAPQRKYLSKKFVMGFLQGRRILDTTFTDDEVHMRHIEMINRQKDCHHLIGYANEIYDLANFSLKHQVPIRRPFKAVFSTASALTQPMRETIEAAFQCPVYNRYGNREMGDLACECPYQEGLHINPMCVKVDVVDNDGHPVPPHTEGNLLLTFLHNYTMPLIRYEVGDMGIVAPPERCRCGREWETLVRLTGRTTEKIYLPDGRSFSGIFAEDAFDMIPNLLKYQIHQVAPDKLVVKLYSWEPGFVQSHARELEAATQWIRIRTGFAFEVVYEQTEAFERTSSGKELAIVTRFRPADVGRCNDPTGEAALV